MKLAIGIMSGTSLDGIDVALVKIKGTFKSTKVEIVDFKTYSMNSDLKKKIESQLNEETSNVKTITSLNFEIAEEFSKGVNQILKENNLTSDEVDFIASHGQTIYHIPIKTENCVPSTLQLGDGSVLANKTKIKTVSNFRTADMALGGQGAPLVPYADFCLFSSEEKDRIMLNIGGIANITYLKKEGSLNEVIAFDTGPGNMVINALMEDFYNKPYDNNGEVARSGKVIDGLLTELMKDEYFMLQPPKSTGREYFGVQYAKEISSKYRNSKKEDIITTLTHFTAKSISKGCRLVSSDLNGFELVASGGGAHNVFMMELIQSYLSEVKVLTTNEFDIDVDLKEALAFIILGNETLLNRPSNVKNATGASDYTVLGQISNIFK